MKLSVSKMVMIFVILLSPYSFGLKVLKTIGDVHLKNKNGVQRVAQSAMNVFDGEIVVTGKESKALLTDGQVIIRIGQMTEFVVQEQKEAITFDIKAGKALFEVDSKDAKKYHFKTPSAVVGVRGTKFYMHSIDGKQVICTIEGNVLVNLRSHESSKQQSTQEPVIANGLSVKAGEGLFIDEKNQTRLDKTDPQKVQNWLKETDI